MFGLLYIALPTLTSPYPELDAAEGYTSIYGPDNGVGQSLASIKMPKNEWGCDFFYPTQHLK